MYFRPALPAQSALQSSQLIFEVLIKKCSVQYKDILLPDVSGDIRGPEREAQALS